MVNAQGMLEAPPEILSNVDRGHIAIMYSTWVGYEMQQKTSTRSELGQAAVGVSVDSWLILWLLGPAPMWMSVVSVALMLWYVALVVARLMGWRGRQ